MGKSNLKIMIDTNVLISGIIYPRSAFEILNYVFNQELRLFLGERILKEAKRNIKKKFPYYLSELEKFLRNCPFELIPDPEEAEIVKNQ